MADLDETMRALKSRTRREILARIWDRDLAAGEIAAAFALTGATISEHLGVLRRAGLVEMTKVGTSRRYRARPSALAGLHGALEDVNKWRATDELPERALTDTSIASVVTATVDLSTPPETTFIALTNAELYSRWLQVPVSIEDGEFAATLEWGTEVRGRYEVVVPPHLIVMSWDFDDGNVPIPGQPLTGYLRIHPDGDGSRVVVHQLVDTPDQATFMAGAWAMVLGRLKANIEATLAGLAPPQRPHRRKESRRD
ncbi:MAG TPA: metalloregulator ArsR/SmtB family transcription factor [Propionibacteriaceae bacterium]|nr:metalloregulator ArsR/SmtB family transcription factor [Propionibacteriaceae bacterium]